MFHKINEGYVVSDEGFKVKLGRHHVSYIETSGRVMSFDVEDTLNPPCLVVYFFSKEACWRPPYHIKKPSGEDFKIIKTRIGDALKFLNIKYEIV